MTLRRRLGDLREQAPLMIIRHRHQLALGVAIVCAVFIAVVGLIVASLPGPEQLGTLGEMSEATTVYDVSDRPVFTIFKEYRVETSLERISPHLRKAIIAIEDQRFFDHHGIDLLRIAGAAVADIRARRVEQGGSTITQQLARQAFLSTDKTLPRKLKEILLALRLERMYSKEEILELYLNRVYFGDGLYGAEAAARGYFGKSAADLSLVESATLAGLVTAPSVNAPTNSLARATARRNLVLGAMLEQGVISRAAWREGTNARIELHDSLRRNEPIGQHFKEEVRQELVRQFGWERVSESGLRVYSTIDPAMQRMAESAVAESLKQIDQRRASLARKSSRTTEDTDQLEVALVALDPTTGEVRAMVGGRDFSNSRFNRAVQALRQPGSAFKPFVYAAALEAGYSPASLVDRLDEPVHTFQGAWMPEDEHAGATSMTVRTALRTSSNRAAVRMLDDIGVSRTVDYARRLGMGTLPSVPSLALGSGEVTLLGMTTAYAAFAAGGLVNAPTLIRRVEDRTGVTLFEHVAKPERAILPTTAFLMASMLADVVNAGTAYKARQAGFMLPAAGKTGTTNDFVDAWFVGFTPKLVAGVWLGFDRPRTILRNGFAGDLAVPLWTRFMKAATAADKPEWFQPPSGIVATNVCRISGQLPAHGCTGIYTEYFARGTEPTEVCSMHAGQSLVGRIASVLGIGPEPPTTSLAAADALSSGAVLPGPPIAPPAATVETAAPERPKRSFWKRIFGLGRSGDARRREDAAVPKPAPKTGEQQATP